MALQSHAPHLDMSKYLTTQQDYATMNMGAQGNPA